jgi:hypothetical protein
MKMQSYLLIAILALASSCGPGIKLSVPQQFSEQATEMPVKGLDGIAGRPISFGTYTTSRIKRGWNITTTRTERPSSINSEERILRIMGVDNRNSVSNQRTKYQYSIQDGNLVAEVYCTERMIKEELEVKTQVRLLGDFSQTKNYQYTFSAVVVPHTVKDDEYWQVALTNNYDRQKDTARRIFDMPYVEEKGFATNGKDTIEIRPVRVTNYTTKSGKDAKIPFKVLTGYELRLDDGVIAIIDGYGRNIWMYKELDAPTKLIVSAVSAALLLRQVQDITG